MKIEKLSTPKGHDLTPREVILFSLSHKQKEKEKITHQTGWGGKGGKYPTCPGFKQVIKECCFLLLFAEDFSGINENCWIFFFLNVQKRAILKDLEFN